MAAEVSSLVRVLNRYKEDQHHLTVGSDSGGDESMAPITRDLLGGSFKLPETQELDLDLPVPNGWEKRLDLKSGKVSLQRCNSPSSPSSLDNNKNHNNPAFPKLQDLNSPPSPSKKSPLNLFGEGPLDLKLVSLAPSSSSCNYQSVCTLDKVKFALERAEKEPLIRKRTSMRKSSSSPSYSSSSSSIRETHEDDDEDRFSMSPVAAAGCPGCLLYVLISKNNPKCPRCNAVVPLPKMKKPRIDLNISI